MAADPRLTGDARLQPVLAAMQQRSYAAAERALAELPSEVRQTPAWTLLRGVVLTKLSRVDEAAQVLRPLARGPEPWASEGAAALADALHLSQQHDDLRELLAQVPAWAATPRGRLFEARLLIRVDPARALAMLMEIVDGPAGAELPRLAGFDAVKLLDRQARYREAHALALRLHALAPPFELDNFLARLRLQQRLLAKGAGWCPPRAEPVSGVALIVGLPRSGTTLLEQMLDTHPDVSGIGEHEGISDLAKAVVGAGVWPYRMSHLGTDSAAAMQQRYVDSARQRMAKPSARWTLDKSLLTWQWLPALAAVMPGAVALRLMRDPRDMAVSAFLSPLDAVAFGWVAGFDSLRQVIEMERALVPQALQALAIPHETIVYEDLVADPAGLVAPVMDRLGLPMDARVLSPEGNERTAVTLSHEQVRRPINDASIGRWRHYDFAFDSRWDSLATAHAAARRDAAAVLGQPADTAVLP
jgi:hypothetical protein